jgi:hypothetical protein
MGVLDVMVSRKHQVQQTKFGGAISMKQDEENNDDAEDHVEYRCRFLANAIVGIRNFGGICEYHRVVCAGCNEGKDSAWHGIGNGT